MGSLGKILRCFTRDYAHKNNYAIYEKTQFSAIYAAQILRRLRAEQKKFINIIYAENAVKFLKKNMNLSKTLINLPIKNTQFTRVK